MIRIFNRLISLIKRENFELDNNIPLWYLFNFIAGKFFSFLRGKILFLSFKNIFIGKRTKIRASNKILIRGNLNIGVNCIVDALSKEGIVMNNNVSLGDSVTIKCSGTLKDIGKGLVLGSNVGIGDGSFLGCAGGITIGDDSILGNYVTMHSENHRFDNIDIPIRLQGITRLGIVIGKDCWFGAKSTVLDGVTMGNGCIVAAGAVVIKGIYPQGSVIAGIPARVIKNRNDK